MENRKRAWGLLVVLFCSLLWSGEAYAIATAPYFPLEAGNSWTYNNSDFGTYTTTVLNGTVAVNGVSTYVLQDSNGLQSYITNDNSGIRIHRQYDPSEWIDGVGYVSINIIYTPPMKMADAETTVGATIYSTGTAVTTISGLGTFSLTYSLTSSIDGFENVIVPAGSYQAVKVTGTTELSGYIQGQYMYESFTDTRWLGKGVGVVKYWYSEPSGYQEEEELISTNVVVQTPPVVYSDFNGDATADILYHHSDDGRLLIWTMNNFARSLHFPVSLANSWSVVGKGDFNADGTSDVLYRKDTGETAIAEMTDAARSKLVFPGGIKSVWNVQAVGDFDGDGSDDILWQRSTDGVTTIWEIEDSTRKRISYPGALASFWRVAGVGDFDNDGTDDILCQHRTDGRLLIWKMNNLIRASVKFAAGLANTWTVVGVGDFNNDGTDDVLYRKDVGDTAIAEFNNLNRTALKFPGGIGTPWNVKDFGDYNGDGMNDILFRRGTDGVTLIWGISNSTRTSVNWPGALAAEWVVQ